MKLKKSLALAAATTLVSLPVFAYEQGDLIVRAGYAHVDPVSDSSRLSAAGAPLPATGVSVDSDSELGITAVYMLTKNVGVELLASTPFTHTINAKGATLAGLGLRGNIGEVTHLPPAVSAQYYFDTGTEYTPYVGAGINYTIMLKDSLDSDAQSILGTGDIDLNDSVGLAFSAGVDVQLDNDLILNAAVWRIDIDTEASIDGSVLGDLDIDVEVDPWVYMVGLGYKF